MIRCQIKIKKNTVLLKETVWVLYGYLWWHQGGGMMLEKYLCLLFVMTAPLIFIWLKRSNPQVLTYLMLAGWSLKQRSKGVGEQFQVTSRLTTPFLCQQSIAEHFKNVCCQNKANWLCQGPSGSLRKSLQGHVLDKLTHFVLMDNTALWHYFCFFAMFYL